MTVPHFQTHPHINKLGPLGPSVLAGAASISLDSGLTHRPDRKNAAAQHDVGRNLRGVPKQWANHGHMYVYIYIYMYIHICIIYI